MQPPAAYFFAEYPVDFALWSGLSAVLRERAPAVRQVIITVPEPYSIGYRYQTFLEGFDERHRLENTAQFLHWQNPLRLRAIASMALWGFPRAYRVKRELRRIQVPDHSLAFVYGGTTLNRCLFLRTMRRAERDVRTVLLTDERGPDRLEDRFVKGRRATFGHNLYLSRFGPSKLDLYWMRMPEGERTSQREYRFRKPPADVVVRGEHALRRTDTGPGEVLFPFYAGDPPDRPSDGDVALIGGSYVWERALHLEPFYRRYNELVRKIRELHPRARLLYFPHPGAPGEREAEIARLGGLPGFEVVRNQSPEQYAVGHPELARAYTVFSTCAFTLAYYGVRTHSLYPLFSSDAIPARLRRRLDHRWASDVDPATYVDDEAAWEAGRFDRPVRDLSGLIRRAADRLLERLGVGSAKVSATSAG